MSTDPARLTDDEREDLWRAYESWTEGDFSEHMGEAVEGIMRARLAQAWDEGYRAAHEVVDLDGVKVWAHTVFPLGCEGNPHRAALEAVIQGRQIEGEGR
jgi:hypothetical protein